MGGRVTRREDELERLEAFLRGSDGRVAAAVVTGEPGIGKTTLWEAAVERARKDSHFVMVARPTESEMQLAFTTLGDVLREVPLGVLDDLPAPQRRALEVALLLTEPTETNADWRAIGSAVLGVLDRLARDQSVLVAIDDAQWVDAPSARVLEFALRRSKPERIRVLLAVRDDTRSPLNPSTAFGTDSVVSVALKGLDIDGVAELLEDRVDLVLPRPRLKQLHERSGGNPLFALELGRSLREDPTSTNWAVPSTLRDLVARRLETVPAEDLLVLRLIAATARPSREVVLRAAGEATDRALASALAANILVAERDTIRFAHPLLGSAVATETAPDEWRHIHARLAQVVTDPEERARHLARAAADPDETIALALEEAAKRAWLRGAPDVAAELAEMSNDATPTAEPDARIRRTVQASEFHYYSGDSKKSETMLRRLLPSLGPGRARAEVLLRLAWFAEQDIEQKNEMYEQAIREAEGDDLIQAHARIGLSYSSMRAGRVRRAAEYQDLALRFAERGDNPVVIAQAEAAVGLTRGLLGEATEDRLRRAIARGTPEAISVYDAPETMLGLVLMWADRIDEARSILERQRRRAVERGDENSLAGILIHLTELETRAANYDSATGHAATARAVYARTQVADTNSALSYALALPTACLGNFDRARELAMHGLELARDSHDRVFMLQNASVLGFIETSRGDGPAGLAHLQEVPHLMLVEMEVGDAGVFRVMPDAIESAVLSRQVDLATSWLSLWRDRARMEGHDWALGTALRCDALIAATNGDVKTAAQLAQDALQHLDAERFALDRGRTLLATAQIERRLRRRRASREALDEAEALLISIGAAAWAERVRTEQSRSSDGRGGRQPDTKKVTHTFMFTDIVASTSLVEAIGDDAWRDLVRWHDRALRESFQEFGGREVDHAGDGFFVAFPDQARAIDCAVAIQRRLLEHRREQGFAPLVRIGVHTAETVVEDGAYRGKEVHRAARIGAMAEAGEIVASAATAGSLRQVTTTMPRSVQLKGFAEPVDVVSIAWRDA